MSQHNPHPGNPFQPTPPGPGEVPSPVRDTPPWQPSDLPASDPPVEPGNPGPSTPPPPTGP